MKRVRFMAAMCMVAMVGFTACGDGDKKEETAENTEMHQDEAADPHAGHDHGDMGHGEASMNTVELEPKTFDQPSEQLAGITATIIDQYLQVKEDLVKTDGEAAMQSSAPLRDLQINQDDMGDVPADQMEYFQQAVQNVRNGAVSISVTNEVEMQREKLPALTEAVYALAKTFGNDETLYYQYCPMAFNNQGAYWISAKEEIENPYFGDKMMNCGRVEETIQQ